MGLRLGILCGGRSGEHEVSLQSAQNIYDAAERSRFDPLLVAVDKKGLWRFGPAEELLLERDGSPDHYCEYWKDPDCKIVHFIGEDNTIFHAITWPAMMLATHDSDSIQGQKGEFQLPHQVVANAFLNIKFPGKEEEKISKSRGTAVWIEEYLKEYDPDPMRYYLTSIAPETARTAFSFDDFIKANNTELLAALGNFFNRTLTFAARYFDNQVPAAGQRNEIELDQLEQRKTAAFKVSENLERYRFKAALHDMMDLARSGNVYFDARQPWKTRKDNMTECGTTINVCIQTLRTLTTLMAPFQPFSARKAAEMLQLGDCFAHWSAATDELPTGHGLGQPQILFKKLEVEENSDG